MPRRTTPFSTRSGNGGNGRTFTICASCPDAADLVSRARDAARKRRADVAALEPKQRAVRHAAIVAAWRRYTALRAASRTALQDFQARIDRRRQEALDTAARARVSARAYRAAVIAARARGEPRAVQDVRRVILLLKAHRGHDTATRARARCSGSCCCEQWADFYYWFTLEGEAAPPP